ncbi:disintegrin and metalloproteinase with thrombospondin motifs 14 [Octopus vulgaris]|uniref:Disintegrin and metalloproteinase with thrombospondin motifs 14 n=1 Tax=Octopus vulgaris TaxID=6645 RepID=A0AA36EZS4_OCTVU|nr:disintegrin and metalloproteinase with thrombospondin motifs 14 [Octopus vulgaris]
MLPLIFLLSTVLLVAPVQPKPIHNLNEPHLKAAKRIGFLEDAFERLHLTELSEILDGGIHHPLNISRIKERQGSQVETILHIPLAELQLKLSLKHPEQILHENAKIVVSNGEEEQHFIVEPRNCYLVGRIDGYSGSASLSYCNGLRGSVVLGDTEYSLEPVDDGARHIVGEHRKQDKHSFVDKVNEAYAFEDDKRVVTVEMALYNDAEMTKMLDAKGFDTLHKKIDYIVSKFNGVQYEYTKIKQLRHKVVFQIKKMEFWTKNPSWFLVSNKLNSMLSSLCKWNADKEPFDLVYLITGHRPIYPIGLAFVGGACRPKSRCGVSMGTAWGRYVAIAHEIGHILGMPHDANTPCSSYPSVHKGLMGGKGTDFSNCSAERFEKKILSKSGHCLFVQNIPDDKVPKELKGLVLKGLPEVINVTHHEYCEKNAGIGFRYREKENLKYSCNSGYYCVKLKEGPGFGLITRESAQGIVGTYCAPGKVCLKKQCLTYKLMHLTKPWIVRAGGWGNWSSYTKCSRTCGTGVQFSFRDCNNPKPIQSKYCDGSEYKAKLCNEQPCPSDPSSYDAIRKTRAGETCKRLINDGSLNATIYKPTGRAYGGKGYNDDCDVHCDNSKHRNSRNAILPDGTPCKHPDPEFNVAGAANLKLHCFRGKCQVFGCDSRFPAQHHGNDPLCSVPVSLK